MYDSAIADLQRALPAGMAVCEPDILAAYRADRADLVPAGIPAALVRPTATAQVQTAMRWASQHGVTVVPRGATTTRDKALDAADKICAAALRLNGTITGEHGVGQLKRRWIGDQLSPTALDVQHRIKSALDPANLLNPRTRILTPICPHSLSAC